MPLLLALGSAAFLVTSSRRVKRDELLATQNEPDTAVEDQHDSDSTGKHHTLLGTKSQSDWNRTRNQPWNTVDTWAR